MAHGWRIERVQVRDQMADLAIGLDEPVDAENAHLAGVDDRLRGAVAARREPAAVAVAREIEPREEDRPALVDRSGILLPSPVLLDDVVLAPERDGLEPTHASSS